MESATASPDLLANSSQETCSPPEQTNMSSQVSDTPKIHGMTLKYPDDGATDEELKELHLQTAAQQYIMQQDAQNETTPLPFQQTQVTSQKLSKENDRYPPYGQNTRLTQIAQNELATLPDGSPGYRLQIPYLQKFFSTPWYLICKDNFKIYTNHDMTFSETHYCDQIEPFNLVALDADLEDHLHSRMSHINTRNEWVTQITDFYEKWISTTTISKPFPHSMLMLHDSHQVHLDFVKATDLLGTIFSAYEDLISADPVNHTTHLTNHNTHLDSARKCFKWLETYVVSDNYFRSISGLPPAPYAESQPSQTELEKNSPNYLTSLANLEVNSILRTLGQPDMYINKNAMSSQLTSGTPLANESEKGMSMEKADDHSPGFRPINQSASENKVQESTQVAHSQGMALTETQATPGQTIHQLTPVNIVDPAPAVSKVNTVTMPCVQQSVMPVSLASTTQVWTDVPVPPTVNPTVPTVSTTRVPLSQIQVWLVPLNTMHSSQPQDQNADPCRKCGKNSHPMARCCKRVMCKKCKGKDHNTRFCTGATAPDNKCTFSRKGKHTTENCRARKRAEKEAESGGQSVITNAMSNPPPLATGKQQTHPASTQSSGTLYLQTSLPDTSVPPLPVGQRLQNLSMGRDATATSTMSHGIPPAQTPPLYTALPNMDGN